jgi:hypothetical protein
MKFNLIALTTITTAVFAAPILLGEGSLVDGILNNGHLPHILPLGSLTNDLTKSLGKLGI